MDDRLVELQRVAASRDDVVHLMGALPARELMPHGELARAAAEAIASHGDALQYTWPEGSERMRAWIAARLALRGARVAPERVIVTSGAQQALAIAAPQLGARAISVGDATYAGALDAFARAGLRVVACGGDASYAICGVANPHGIALPAPVGARATIADEAYVELRFDGVVPAPLVAGDADHVWHVGTISKTLAPGLRVGWLVPPRAHHAAALAAKQAADLQSSSLAQAALARLLAVIDYDAHLARARAHYARAADALASALRRELPFARFREPEGGLSLWLETDEPGDEVGLLAAALDHGVMVDPGSAFRPLPDARIALRISFSNASPRELADGAHRLAAAFHAWLSAGSRATG